MLSHLIPHNPVKTHSIPFHPILSDPILFHPNQSYTSPAFMHGFCFWLGGAQCPVKVVLIRPWMTETAESEPNTLYIMASGKQEVQLKCCRNRIVIISTKEQSVCVNHRGSTSMGEGLDIWGCVGVWVLDVQYSLVVMIHFSYSSLKPLMKWCLLMFPKRSFFFFKRLFLTTLSKHH